MNRARAWRTRRDRPEGLSLRVFAASLKRWTNPIHGGVRLSGGGMSKPRLSVIAQPATDAATRPLPGEVLERAFNELRDELLSTLCYLLKNAEDAQDVAQEAFLRCLRSQDSLAGVENLRRWIFRVSINVAKDLQRSAWRRSRDRYREGI